MFSSALMSRKVKPLNLVFINVFIQSIIASCSNSDRWIVSSSGNSLYISRIDVRIFLVREDIFAEIYPGEFNGLVCIVLLSRFSY